MSKAESRTPANLKDVEGLLFISSRPGEGVRNEISLVMNFDLKEDVEHQAIIGSDRFALVAKGQNVWLKNPAEEGRMLDALRKGSGLEDQGHLEARQRHQRQVFARRHLADRQAGRRRLQIG